MIKHQPVHINKWLLPFSWLYGLIVFFRNKFFDWGIFKQEEFDIPIICIGNITVGGTGKTPHTEYLIRLLQNKYRVGVLSRGYKRKTNGFVLATKDSTSKDIGDESFQIKNKFPDIIVAVDGDRRRGIKNMLALKNPPQVILLDDAFQHRYVKPSFTIVLSDFNRPVYEDILLPAGRLREPFGAIDEANMIIVTKCPHDLQPIDYRIITHDINPFPYQSLYFTTLNYSEVKPVFPDSGKKQPLEFLRNKDILLATGIASPAMILKMLSEYTAKVETITYPDHYNFKSKDIKHISDKFKSIQSENKIILVTEKDASRLILKKNIDKEIKKQLYYLPIEISFMENKSDFNAKIIGHIKSEKFKDLNI